MSLRILSRSRADQLASALLAGLDEGVDDPFEPVTVLVPSLAAGRWLRERCAREAGVCAHFRTDYPARFAWRVFEAVLQPFSQALPLDPHVTAWPLFRTLQRLAPAAREGRLPAHFSPLAPVLAEGDEGEHWRLACRIAQAFERYFNERPDWAGRRLQLPENVAAHAHGPWQQALWETLAGEIPELAPRHPYPRFLEALPGTDPARLRERLGRRIVYFGPPSLAPMHADLLVRLSEVLDVRLGLLNPCREFWQDVVPLRTRVKWQQQDPDVARLMDVGHPLLATWGRAARDGLAVIDGHIEGRECEDDIERPEHVPAADTVLARLQDAIRGLAPDHLGAERPFGEDAPAAATPCASVQMHACHGALRQAEVLHDLLLEAFETLPDLAPHEVAVLSPQLDAVAPAIEAVFGAASGPRIPFRITGRRRAQPPLAEGTLSLLRWAAGRACARELLDLLAEPAMQASLDLGDEALERLRAWVDEAGMRTGLAGSRHALRSGLRRLLLGAALHADDSGFQDDGAAGDAEGGELDTLERLTRLADLLAPFAQRVPRRVDAWCADLRAAVLGLHPEAAGSDEGLMALVDAIGRLETEVAPTGAHELAVGAAVVLEALADRVEAGAPGALATGAVTVGPLEALAVLPWRVVAIVGADDRVFPRAERPPEWDLCNLARRAGDRTPRHEDRGAFLQALMQAQDRLLVLYTGRDALRNDPRNASQPVEELREHLLRRVGPGGWVDRQHTLHAADPRNFRAACATYDRDAARAAVHLALAGRERPHGAWADAVESMAPPPLPARLELRDLVAMLVDAPGWWLRRVLQAPVEFEPRPVQHDDTPLACEPELSRQLLDAAVERLLRGEPPERLQRWLAHQGMLPEGVFGEHAARGLLHDALAWRARVLACAGERVRPAEAAFELVPGCVLAGRVDLLHARARALRTDTWKGADGDLPAIKPRVLLRAWLPHLALQALGDARPAVMLTPDKAWHFGALPAAHARACLQDLAELWREGHAHAPVFAPETALRLHTGSDAQKCQDAWLGDARHAGESSYDGWRAAWRERLPEIEAHRPLADRVWSPLLAALREGTPS